MTQASASTLELPALPGVAKKARCEVINRIRRLSNLPTNDLQDLEVAIGEAFSNIVLHGAKPDDYVMIRVERSGNRICIVLEYPGKPFNPTPRVPEPEDLAVHGYGLFIIRSVMDSVRYSFENGRARVCLEKRL